MTLTVTPIPVLSDNYAWLLRCGQTGVVGIVDPGEADPVAAQIGAAPVDTDPAGAAGRLDFIILTHHHADHTGGVAALRERFGARVAGPASEAHRMPRLDIALRGDDTLGFGAQRAFAIPTPGHADGHLSFAFTDHAPPLLFCGDALFALGCGRLLEGTAEELYASLRRFADLPDDTRVYAGHEYTAANARFARHVDPDNTALRRREDEITRLRAAGMPTLPSTLGEERATNPFLRAPDASAFADLRAAKDRF